jgi:hypothetical protein
MTSHAAAAIAQKYATTLCTRIYSRVTLSQNVLPSRFFSSITHNSMTLFIHVQYVVVLRIVRTGIPCV